MAHPDDEVLAQFALDDPLAVDAATMVHIADCAQCSRKIDDIQRAVDAVLTAGGRSDLRTLAQPPPHVWSGVLARVGATARPEPVPTQLRGASAQQAWPPSSVRPDDSWFFDRPGVIGLESAAGSEQRVGDTADRRTFWLAAAAAAAGLILGAGVTWLVTGGQDRSVSDDVATSELTSIGRHETSGVISLTQRGGGAPEITIDLDRLDEGKGFVEAWLIDDQTGGVVALGVIDGTEGTFVVPPALNLSRYSVVDVSREPFDGDPAHSTRTLARGPVPSE